jgi:hypothetical protein
MDHAPKNNLWLENDKIVQVHRPQFHGRPGGQRLDGRGRRMTAGLAWRDRQ